MFLLITVRNAIVQLKSDLNTSHVLINHRSCCRRGGFSYYLNTSHVLINQCQDFSQR